MIVLSLISSRIGPGSSALAGYSAKNLHKLVKKGVNKPTILNQKRLLYRRNYVAHFSSILLKGMSNYTEYY